MADDEACFENWAKVPGSVIESGLDPWCFRLYAELDFRSGNDGREQRGLRAIARRLGWQARTVSEHAEHLVKHGLVSLDLRHGAEKAVIHLTHNPSRGLCGPAADLPPVSVSTSTRRRRPAPPERTESGASDAGGSPESGASDAGGSPDGAWHAPHGASHAGGYGASHAGGSSSFSEEEVWEGGASDFEAVEGEEIHVGAEPIFEAERLCPHGVPLPSKEEFCDCRF